MPDPISGALAGSALLSLGGAYLQSQGAEKAGEAQAGAAQAGIDEQRRQFDAMQQLLAPYRQAGTGALSAQQALLGLAGPEAQQAAISQLEQSPQYQAMVQQGERGILQNAAATGGLRGGNVQAALAQFRPQMLSQMIQQQMGQLGGLAGMGMQGAMGTAGYGMQTAGNVANLLGQQGAAQAGATLGQYGAFGQALGGMGQTAGTLAGFGMMGKGPLAGKF